MIIDCMRNPSRRKELIAEAQGELPKVGIIISEKRDADTPIFVSTPPNSPNPLYDAFYMSQETTEPPPREISRREIFLPGILHGTFEFTD